MQADAWHTAMKHTRQAMEALAGGGRESGNMEDWESSSVASSEGGALAAGAGEKPTLEVRASLGEFAIFVSGRVCDDWWPTNGEMVCFWASTATKMQKHVQVLHFGVQQVVLQGMRIQLSRACRGYLNGSVWQHAVALAAAATPAGLPTKIRFLPQDDTASTPEEHRGIVNVDGERPLVVVRASGAHSDISFRKDHLGIGVAIGAS